MPIPGTTKLHRLADNLAAADRDLTTANLAAPEKATADIRVEGERYPEALMATVGRAAPNAFENFARRMLETNRADSTTEFDIAAFPYRYLPGDATEAGGWPEAVLRRQ